MSFTSKILKSVGAVAAVFAMSSAIAGPATLINVYDGAGNALASNVEALDWLESGSGLAVGVGLPTTLKAGTTFDFQYQAKLGAYTTGAIGTFADGLNKTYEITVVATINELVSKATPAGDGINTTVEFKATGGTLRIYYSNVVDANVAAGTGFDNGTLIGTFAVQAGGNSTLATFFGDGAAGGFTNYTFDTVGLVDTTFLTGSDVINGMTFFSSQTIPPGSSQTAQVNGVSTREGTLLKVDGSSTFTTVPEPSILALMGLGLVGLSFGARRRKS